MSTIGVLNLLMKANSDPFSKDIKKGKEAIKDIKQEAAEAGGSFASFSSGMSKFGTAIAGIGAAIGAAAIAKGLFDITSESLKTVAATGKLSDRLGITTEDLIGLQHAAKITLGADQVDAFGDSLTEMQKKLGEISLEDSGQKDLLKTIGLDGAAMASQSAVENFGQIGDAIQKVQSKAEKLQIADAIFGGQGAALLPLLEQGSAGINEFSAEAEKMGLMFSNVDAAKVEMANQAVTRLGEMVNVVGQNLAIGLAPYITAAADAFGKLSQQGWDMSETISAGMKWVGAGVGVVADVVHTLGLGFNFLQALTSKAFALMVDGVASFGEGLEYLLNLIPGVSVSFGTMARDMADEMHSLADGSLQGAMDALAAPPPSQGINQFFSDIESNATKAAEEIAKARKPVDDLGASFLAVTKKVGDLESKLNDQIATFGLSSTQAEIYKLKQEGATESQIANVKSLADQITKLEEKKKVEDDLASKAKSLIESSKTPLEKYQTEITELQTMLKNGLIDQSTFDKASMKAQKDLNGENKMAGNAMKVGSDEGRLAILKFKGMDQQDPDKQVANNTAKIASASEKQNTLFEKLLTKMDSDDSFNFN